MSLTIRDAAGMIFRKVRCPECWGRGKTKMIWRVGRKRFTKYPQCRNCKGDGFIWRERKRGI